MEKNSKPTKCTEVIAGKALHVKRFITEYEQYRFLTEALALWKEKVDVVESVGKYAEGLFLDIEHKANEIPSVKPLLASLASIQNIPEFKTFQPRYIVGHRYGLDGTLKSHVDGVQGWAAIINIGCSAVLEISQGNASKKREVTLKSGDAFIFACDRASNIEHSVKKIKSGTCPKKLEDLAADRRYAFIIRDHLATEVASLIEVTQKFENVILAEHSTVNRIWDTSDSFKNQVLRETFPTLPLEISEYLTEQFDAKGMCKFAQLTTGTSQYVQLSDKIWKKIYQKANPKDRNDYKLRTTWEQLVQRTYRPDPPADVMSVVVHFGSYNVQMGLAGDDAPSMLPPSLVKKLDGHYYAGDDVSHVNGGQLIRPIIGREVIDKNAFEMVWEYSAARAQHGEREDIGTLVLLSDQKAAIREKTTQIAFETWDAPIYYLSNPHVTCVYAAGVTSALVLDVGYDITTVNVIYEGYLLPHIVKSLKVGGRTVDTVLREKLQKECPELLEHVDLESFKRQHCYVKSAKAADTETKQVVVKGKAYTVNSVVLTDPCEVLFHPENFSLAGCSLVDQIQDVINGLIREDKEMVKVGSTIVLSGGPTLHTGFVARLEQELKELFPNMEFKIIAQNTRQFDSWIGGSILGSLSTFPSMWITRKEYDETGPTIVHRKCF